MTAKDLKNALLQEAVQGKLVPQIASEGNAKDLLEEIRRSRHSELVSESKSKKMLKQVQHDTIPEDELPFDIPENWCWCRLEELISLLTDFSANGSYEKLDSNVKMYDEPNYALMVRTTDLERNDFSKSVKYIDQNAYNLLSKSTLYGNEIIMNKIGSAGKIYIMPCLNKPATLGRNAFLIRFYKFLNTYLIFDFLSSPYGFEKIKEHVHGAVTKTITKDDVKSILFPLPPLAEQKRIVAAIEKFMPLIEEYGKKETELKACNEQIGALTKKAILQEAVQGKLVPQIAAEGNAKDLLEEIKKEKAKLIKEGKIKKEKPLPEISDDEIPFDIPENWCWCRLGECVNDCYQGINTAGVHTKFVLSDGVPIIQTGDMSDGKIDISKTKLMSFSDYEIYKDKYQPQYDDIFYCNIGTIGKPLIYRENYTMLFHWNLFIFKYNKYKLIPEYLKLVLEWITSFFEKNTDGTAMQFVSKKKIVTALIPLPPLAEQKRIVAKLEDLLPLCE